MRSAPSAPATNRLRRLEESRVALQSQLGSTEIQLGDANSAAQRHYRWFLDARSDAHRLRGVLREVGVSAIVDQHREGAWLCCRQMPEHRWRAGAARGRSTVWKGRGSDGASASVFRRESVDVTSNARNGGARKCRAGGDVTAMRVRPHEPKPRRTHRSGLDPGQGPVHRGMRGRAFLVLFSELVKTPYSVWETDILTDTELAPHKRTLDTRPWLTRRTPRRPLQTPPTGPVP
jgi:hypothetical protein